MGRIWDVVCEYADKVSSQGKHWLGVGTGCLLSVWTMTSVAQAQPIPPAAVVPSASSTPTLLRPLELAARLSQGGYLVVMRHERTELRSRDDDYSKPLNDCLSQRNLSVAGLAGAGETGEAIRLANVPIARVISSPMCRATETARAAFGTRIESENSLAHPDPSSTEAMRTGRAATLAFANTLPLNGGNIVLVTHQPNLFAFDIRLGEGETAAFKKEEMGRWNLIGRATGSDWSGIARSVLARHGPQHSSDQPR